MFKRRINKHIINLSLLFATCLSMLVGSSAWILASKSNVTEKVDTSVPEAYVKINNSGNPIYYATVEQALNNHVNDTASVFVIPGTASSPKEITIDQKCEVGSNVTLNFPIAGETIENPDNSTSVNGFGSENSRVVTYVKISSINNSPTITINQGGIVNIGGQRCSTSPQSATSGDCVVLELQDNAIIDCRGTINCYGFIKESKDNNNSLINVYSTGLIKQPLIIYDWSGGTKNPGNVLYKYPETGGIKTFPFNYFDTIQIAPEIRFYNGANLIGMVWVFVPTTSSSVKEEGTLIGNNGLIRPYTMDENHYISWKCTDIGANNSLTNSKTNHIIDIVVNGNYNLESFLIPMSVNIIISIDTDINSAEYFLPFSNFFNLTIKSGSNVNVNEKVKMMPGSSLLIEPNAILNINNQFIVEDPSTFTNSIYEYRSNPTPASFINNGIVNINGQFGGYIQAGENGNNETKIVVGNSNSSVYSFETSGYTTSELGDLSNVLATGTVDKPTLFVVEESCSADLVSSDGAIKETNLSNNTTYYYESDNNNYYWSIPESSFFNIQIVDPLDTNLFAATSTYDISLLDENSNEISNINNFIDYQTRILENYQIRINSISNYSNAIIVKEDGSSEDVNSFPYTISAKDYFNATLQITPLTYTPKLQYSTDGTTWHDQSGNMSADNSWKGQFRIIPEQSNIDLSLTNMSITGEYDSLTDSGTIGFNGNVSDTVSLEHGSIFGIPISRTYTITIVVTDNNTKDNNANRSKTFSFEFTVT